MPELVVPGDVVVIDGPKELRALRLAMRTIEQRKPAFVFIHDCRKGSTIRRFLERHVPWAFFSDHPRWVTASCHFDRYLGDEVVERWSNVNAFPNDRSYAGTFGCLPLREGFPAAADYARLAITQAGKLFGEGVEAPRPGVAEAGP